MARWWDGQIKTEIEGGEMGVASMVNTDFFLFQV